MGSGSQGPVGSPNSSAVILLSLKRTNAFYGDHIKNLVDHITKLNIVYQVKAKQAEK